MGDTTSSTKLPNPSPQESALMNQVLSTLYPAYMSNLGYDVTPKTVGWNDSDQFKTLSSQQQAIQTKIDALGPKPASDSDGKWYSQSQSLQGQLSSINKKIEDAQANYQPVQSFDTRKKEPTLALEDAYQQVQSGKMSQGDFDSMKSDYTKGQVAMENQANDIQKTYMDKTMKFLNGDFSITDDQKNLIEQNMAPVKASVESMFSDSMTQTDKNLSDFVDQVGKTKMSVEAALDVTGDQIKNTGADMSTALKNVVDTNTSLMKMGIDDYTGKLTKSVNSNAAAMGRDPSDPEFQNQIQTQVAKQVKEGTLNLAQMEANGELAIAERTGAGLEGLDQQRAALESQTGNQIAGAISQTGAEKSALVQQKGTAETSLAESGANLRWQVGSGMVPQELSVGAGGSSYYQGILNQRMANAGAGMNGAMGLVGNYQDMRKAQPTVTQSQDPWMTGLQVAGGLTSMAGGIYGGVNAASALRSMAGSYGGGGGGGGYGSPSLGVPVDFSSYYQ